MNVVRNSVQDFGGFTATTAGVYIHLVRIEQLHGSLLPKPAYRLVVPHEELGVLLEDVLGGLARHGDDGGVVPLLTCLLEAGADRLEAEHLQALLLGLVVLLELAQKGPLAELRQVAGLVRIWDVPFILRFAKESKVLSPKSKVAFLSLVRGSQIFNALAQSGALAHPGDDLLRDRSPAVVAEEVLLQQLGELERLLVLLGLLADLRLPGKLVLEPLDGGSLVGDDELEREDVLHLHAFPVVLRHLLRQ